MRPQGLRCVVVLVGFWIALVLAVLHRVEQHNLEPYASYLLLIAAITLNQAVIWAWRCKIDKNLKMETIEETAV
jgi:RsiW-degrading membrane proteinase PrsW (M82 family)